MMNEQILSTPGDSFSFDSVQELVQQLAEAEIILQSLLAGEQISDIDRDRLSPSIIRKARQALAESQRWESNLLQAVCEANPGGLAVVAGRELVFQLVNPAYRALTPQPEIDPLGRTFDEVWPPAEGFGSSSILRQVIETGEPAEDHFQHQFPDGVIHHYSFHIGRISWKDQPAALVVIWETTNVELAHQMAEQALRESEASLNARAAELAAVLDAVPATVWIAYDTECKWVAGSRASYEMLRMPYGSNQSKTAPAGEAPVHFRVFKDGKELAPQELPLQVAAAQGIEIRDFEEEILFEDGAVLHAIGNVTPLLDEQGQPRGAVAAFIDISGRVRAEQALQESEQRYRSLFESMAEGFVLQEIICDSAGQPEDFRFLDVNPAFERITGISRQAVIGRTSKEVAPDSDPIWIERFAQVALTGQPAHFEMYSPSTRKYLEVNAFRPGTMRCATVFTDITGRKMAEEALQNYARQLERSNRELQEFAFVASHDLQEPLRKIQAFGDRLRARTEAILGEEELDYLERMRNAANRMRAMIEDLLALSRVTTQGQPFVPVDLQRVATEVVSDLELSIQNYGGSVEVAGLPVVEADPLQMRQLLQNLIGNALKFHRQGIPPKVKVSATVGTDTNGITQHSMPATSTQPLPPAQVVQIYIEDNGIGFEEKRLELALQPFQRLHGVNKYEGSGMGLSICRKIIERHGGRLTARSTVGQGSTFIVTLPVQHTPKLSLS